MLTDGRVAVAVQNWVIGCWGKKFMARCLRESIGYRTIQRMGAAGSCWRWVLLATARCRSRAVEGEGLEELGMENLVPVKPPSLPVQDGKPFLLQCPSTSSPDHCEPQVSWQGKQKHLHWQAVKVGL